MKSIILIFIIFFQKKTFILGYTFNIDDPTKHCEMLSTSSPITSIAYSHKEHFLLAGGCYNGQICWWDVRYTFSFRMRQCICIKLNICRAGNDPVGSVDFEYCHSEPVYKTLWTASKSGSEIMTGGSDGRVRWWDIRNFTKAKEEFIVDIENQDIKSSGFTILTCKQ